eukprot:5432320-Pyramimonas_sp.AAC.1
MPTGINPAASFASSIIWRSAILTQLSLLQGECHAVVEDVMTISSNGRLLSVTFGSNVSLGDLMVLCPTGMSACT